MGKQKELELEYGQMLVRKILENTILINYMDAQRRNTQMVTVIGGNSRMVKGKDMEHGRELMETDTSGNTWIIVTTGMEYTDGLVEKYITGSGNRIIKMVKDIKGGQMAMNIGEGTRITRNRETESQKKKVYYTETNTNKACAWAGLKYSEVLDF
jgi:hypothetical protein